MKAEFCKIWCRCLRERSRIVQLAGIWEFQNSNCVSREVCDNPNLWTRTYCYGTFKEYRTFKKIRCDHYRRGPSGLDSAHLAREEWAFGLGLGKGKVSSGSRRGIAAALLLFAL